MFNGPLKIDPTVSATVVIPPAKAQTLFHHVLSITLAYYICTLYAHSDSGHIAHVQHVLHKSIRQLTPPLLYADPERV